ncbi:hypothetical protein Sjap_008909 [Stephania japonica]|uniref:Uncharacterized protein n=1 Tax=Stephania japonica TaxID=461633 RepID=A0AAP0JSR8_9MAGN
MYRLSCHPFETNRFYWSVVMLLKLIDFVRVSVAAVFQIREIERWSFPLHMQTHTKIMRYC